MMEYLGLILQFAILFIGILFIGHDLDKKEIGMKNKIRWLWVLGLIFGWYFLGIVGVVIVLVGYYIWSRKIYES
ncbi:hypothetical protein AKJ57_04640 [candidate division MSBL1 archaeon SCGC-AAA259A05]|uniref:Cardiolipin synthase N-terminal domain-containing protein n=1 Tax=candidate division MSBL1 archaeon SCGC-AAA259A05 TaxID=1698259 RepID=A0A133U6Z4_9EURY|nr:hypothetical protein AKJ57_04640 [candidate division MSBL1 archaeon SCGC-AAA259A05]